ncbi:MAG: Hsp20/alpha crystallin family protein [Clostridiales bacterium]|nr:Hsp20/alpha crystallin family protein [Clostridiales bacterium]
MAMYTMVPFGRRSDSLVSLFDQMERSFWKDTGTSFSSFPTDIRDEGDKFTLSAELPGFHKEDIHLSLDGGVLTISAQHEENNEQKDEKGSYLCRERHYGSYQRSFSISGIQENAISASYENGVLKLTLPKETPVVPAARQINIQ